ncbi:MAG TPA: methyltransferase [Casimicrobiaceae bacterium]|nr:methyltransferase [Casimicrobiaceae bacterium]
MMDHSSTAGGAQDALHAHLLRLVYGGQVAQIIYVAAKLGLPDLLAAGSRTTRELATGTTIEEPTLRRLLRGLVALGLCCEAEPERYELSELGQFLRSDHPRSLRARTLFNTEVLSPIWKRMLDASRTGASGALDALGMPFYEYLQQHPETGELFDRTMADAVRYRVQAALEAYDFSAFRKVVDVGGGNGAFLVEILKRWTRLEGVIFELPGVAERTCHAIVATPESGRCIVQAGNALERVTEGADCYVLSNLLVSMDDDDGAKVLRSCRRAMTGGGKVLIIDWIMPTGAEQSDEFIRWDIASMDLNMLAIHGTGGWRVRTRDEFDHIIKAAGLVVIRVVPTASAVSVIECAAA